MEEANPTAGPGHPDCEIGAGPFVAGREKWVLLVSMAVVFFLLLSLYCGVLSVLLPNQIERLNPDGKAGDLAVVFAVTSIFSTLTTPIAGALSDRTRTRFGRRTPWIVLGSVLGAACLMLVSQMTALWAITLFWVGATITLNSMQAAVTTIVADRFHEDERGVASGFVGAGMTAGCTVGIIVAGLIAPAITSAYFLFAIAVAAACILFVILNPEPRFTGGPAEPFRLREFAKSFWVSPRKHPDFAWAFLGRFTIYMGYQAIVTYLLYILQDYIHLSVALSNDTIAKLSTITFIALVFSAFGSGFLSDKWGRRKPLVFAASIIMGAAMIVPLFLPTVQGMIGYAVLIGLGYGAFMSVDMALMTQVLPKADGGDTGKDLGLLTTAVNIPQILSPVWAAWLLNMTGEDYRALFVSAIAFVFAGSLFVWPIRSVR
ncbi:MFS transporter [Stakelama saccharophila]|uniref:MFS transporter n=1 Tax=Stakelama saccharophila TaxID=3075605 RepID=A0ABZ0B5E5_9SPHN|nr:MFS transporter [Stakelama sp. W311]WNO52396.1 MFS transporter [Stakelama sp. W311]